MATRRRGKGLRASRTKAPAKMSSGDLGHRLFRQLDRMEEPLRQALQFVRVIELAHLPHDEEMEAIAFVAVAVEARLRLEAVEGVWRKLYSEARAMR